jgi:hypothetical protein
MIADCRFLIDDLSYINNYKSKQNSSSRLSSPTALVQSILGCLPTAGWWWGGWDEVKQRVI